MLASPLPSGGMKLANSCSSAFLRKNCSNCGLPGPVTDAQRDQIIEKIQRGTAALSAFLLSSPLSGSSPGAASRQIANPHTLKTNGHHFTVDASPRTTTQRPALSHPTVMKQTTDSASPSPSTYLFFDAPYADQHAVLGINLSLLNVSDAISNVHQRYKPTYTFTNDTHNPTSSPWCSRHTASTHNAPAHPHTNTIHLTTYHVPRTAYGTRHTTNAHATIRQRAELSAAQRPAGKSTPSANYA